MLTLPQHGVDRLGGDTPAERPASRVSYGRRRRLASCLTVVLVAAISLLSITGFLDTTARQGRQNQLLLRTREARITLLALVDAETAVRGYVLTGHPVYLQPYYAGSARLQSDQLPSVRALDAIGDVDQPADRHAVSRRIAQELRLWEDVISLGVGHQDAAVAMLEARGGKPVMDQLRVILGRYIDQNLADWQRRSAALVLEQDLLLIATGAGGLVTVLALVYALYRSGREAEQRERAMAEAVRSREQAIAGREEVRQVFAMAEALQSASGLPDGAAILRASAMRLLPQIGGALYVFNNSRDRLDLVIAWDACGDAAADFMPGPEPAPFLIPDECWALKRSKPHLNGDGPEALRCCHAPHGACSLEVPMIGRGEPVGLLVLHASSAGAEARLTRSTDIACVLADSMSLALSSIMLRDKLRNQAVRDSLTGLYNRRFLEEVLQTLSAQAQRRRSALSAIMIDLDHFKRLNDEHGHAMGDTVLKGAAIAVLDTLRASDVACRFGGEELVVLLPDCTIEMAVAKAEQMRERIHRLTRDNGPQVSASFGVASLPLTARDGDELLATADAALYRAKQQGRNRVVAAAPLSATTEWHNLVDLPVYGIGSIRLPAKLEGLGSTTL